MAAICRQMQAMTETSALLPMTDRPLRSKARARARRDRLVLWGLMGLMALGVAGLAQATGWRELAVQLARITPGQIALLLGLSLVNYLLRGLRWHLFARRLGLQTGLGQDLRHFLGGFAMSVTPGRLGELVRMRWIRRETGWSFERTAPLALADRASDLAAMGLLLAVMLGLSGADIAWGRPVAALALVASVVVTQPVLLNALAGLGWRLSGRFGRLFAGLRRAARSLARFRSPGVLLLAAVLGALGWMAEGAAFWLLLGWMGADVSLPTATAIFLFSALAGGLTGAPGGIGGAEAAMLALLTLQGVAVETALPATLIIRATTLWFAIAIGLVVFPWAEKLSLRGRYALEGN